MVEHLRPTASADKSHSPAGNAEVMILGWDAQGRITAFNEAAQRMTGYSRAELDCPGWLELLVPKDRYPQTWRMFGRFPETTLPEAFECPIRTRSGGERRIAWQSSTWAEEGRLVGTIACGSEITDRSLVAALEHSGPDPSSLILETTSDGFCLLDTEARFLDANDAYCRMTGYSREEICELSVADIEAIDEPEEVQRRVEHLRREGSGRFESRHRCKNGRLIDVEVTINFMHTQKGRFFAFIRDITQRKRAEQALRESEQHLRGVTASAPGVVFEFYARPDGSRGFHYLSPQSETILGLAANLDDYLARFVALVMPEHQQALLESIETAIREESPWYFEAPLRKPSGEIIRCTGNATPVKRDNELVFIGILLDTTAHYRAEKALRESSQLNEQIIQSVQEGIIVYDRELRYRVWNPFMEQLTGIPASQVLGRTPMDVFSFALGRGMPEWDERLERIQGAMEGRSYPPKDFPFEIPQYDRSGWTADTAAPLRNASDEIIGVIGTVRDITERKRAEQALRESRQRLHDIIEFLPDPTFAVNREGKVIAWNRAIEDMTGVPAGEMIGKANYEYALPFYGRRQPILIDFVFAPQPEFESEYTFIKRFGEALFAETHTCMANGKQLYLSGKATPIRDTNGEFVGAIELIRDITEQRRAEQDRAELREQLYQAQKMEAIGQLAGGVAHDFNNLLTVILGAIDGIRNHSPEDSAIREAATTIKDAAQQAIGVTKSLLTFSRRLPAEKHPVTLQDIVQTASRILHRLLPKSIEVIVSNPPEPRLWIDADATQLQQVLLNLAINARDAMPEGGTLAISVSAEQTGDDPEEPASSSPLFARLTMRDTGVGIPEEAMSHLFEPFFTTKSRGYGTGLGLAIVHGIVESHDGRIEVESARGKGASFSVFLPCIEHQPASPQPAKDVAIPLGRGETILLAEDNQFVRGTVVSMLQGLGYKVIPAADGAALMKEWQAHGDRANLLILDVELPNRTGLECLQAIRQEGADHPCILITGIADHSIEDDIDEHTLLLRKPFGVNQLGMLVGRLLRTPSRGGADS